MNELSQIARQIHLCGASVRENVSRVLVRYAKSGEFPIVFRDVEHQVFKTALVIYISNGKGFYYLEITFRTIPLASLCKRTVSVSYQLMGTRARYALDFEREVYVLKYRMMTITIKMLS